ncbi:MAG: hypothetical protein WBF17_03475, partial [Phycisphaerae bacterium]
MAKRIIAVLFILTAPTAAASGEADPAPNIAGETIEQAAKRTGYTVEEIRRCFPPIEQWAVEPGPGKVAESFARDRFRKPPKPGVHPRVYFNPEDLPDIRRRLRETQV